MRIPIPLQRLPQSDATSGTCGILARLLSPHDRSECILCLASGLPGGGIAEVAELHLDREFPNAVAPEFALGHETLPPLADQHEEAWQVRVPHLVLFLVGIGQAQHHLVSQGSR
jgi:hypothetical protein